MARRCQSGLFGLLYLQQALAVSLSTPTATPAATGASLPTIPRETLAPNAPTYELRHRQLFDADNSTDNSVSDYDFSSGESASRAVTTATSWVPASACGYVNGIMDESHSIYCRSNAQCVFHTSDSNFPGLVGCCENDDPQYCAFETTCYERDEILSTSGLTDYPTYMFAVYCTDPSSALCRTWTYPELSITDYGCHDSRVVQSVYLTATPIDSSDDTYFNSYPTIAAVSASVVDDDFMRVYISGSAAASSDKPDKATSSAVSSSHRAGATSTSLSSSSSDDSAPSKGSSTNVGAIAGGVVGGVLGVAGIAAACIMFYLLKKKKKSEYTPTATDVPPQSPGVGGSALSPPPMQQARESVLSSSSPSEVDGNTYQKFAEVDGFGTPQKFPTQAEAPVPGFNPYEMDGHYAADPTIAELPSNQPPPRYP